jgi:hypothetical protein
MLLPVTPTYTQRNRNLKIILSMSNKGSIIFFNASDFSSLLMIVNDDKQNLFCFRSVLCKLPRSLIFPT